MKTRKTYYTTLKNPFMWLSVALVVSSCVWGIMYGSARYGGAWLGIVLPAAAALWYALDLILGGRMHMYKIALPAGLFLVVLAMRMMINERSYPVGYVSMYLMIALVFGWTISGRGFSRRWLVALFAIPLAALVCEMKLANRDLTVVLPEVLFFSGMMALVCSLHRRPDDGTYYPTWGDRPDGRKIRSLSPYFLVIPYIMKTRNTSQNFISDSIEATKMDAYIRKKRREGLAGFGITHVLIAAYVRTVSQYPGLNRFTSGQKIFSRPDIQVNMAIKKEMTTGSPDTVIKMFFKQTDTAQDVYKEVNTKFAEAKKPTLDSAFDNTARILTYIPGLLLRFTVAFLQFLDYFGLLPNWLMHISPFHGSMFITSMASLGIPPIYHHLYDFGNVPIFVAFGIKRRVNEVVDDGKVVRRQYVDYTVVTDERICDGFYYATAMKYMKKIMANPECLDTPPEEVVQDIY